MRLPSRTQLTTPGQRFNGTFTATALEPAGFGGSMEPTRFVGGTLSGPPATGAYVVGDVAVAQDGSLWVCTIAGEPGSWTASGTIASADETITGDWTFTQQPSVPSLEINGGILTYAAGVLSIDGNPLS